jgi:hypothetical protein
LFFVLSLLQSAQQNADSVCASVLLAFVYSTANTVCILLLRSELGNQPNKQHVIGSSVIYKDRRTNPFLFAVYVASYIELHVVNGACTYAWRMHATCVSRSSIQYCIRCTVCTGTARLHGDHAPPRTGIFLVSCLPAATSTVQCFTVLLALQSYV